jgi:23S rRNA G2445 N2-methylase RlmL
MALLTRPASDDVFMDPMCGSGTLLLERAQMGRYQLLLGGDSDPEAVEATLANFGPRHQPRRIERWDARRLPLEDGSVNKIACNLPWGRQVGEQAAMPALYRDFLAEAARVLSPGGRMVLLTSEWNALKTALGACSELDLEETNRDVSILGRRADIFVITRR